MTVLAGTVVRVAARLLAGPLVIAGFLLPWAHGPGLFSASTFSGYDLISTMDRLQQLDVQVVPDGLIWAVRIAILGVAVAAVWHSLLAPAHRWHPFYALSGWYLAVGAAVAIVIGAVRSGLVMPPSGLLLWSVGAALFLLSGPHLRLASVLRRVSGRRPSSKPGEGELPSAEGAQFLTRPSGTLSTSSVERETTKHQPRMLPHKR